MAINAIGQNIATSGAVDTTKAVEDKTVLAKDDFLKLLLVELQNQDPTAPMDTEKILSQTSQLATLEASQNTNDALEKLTVSLGSSQQFTTIAAIGKTADLGSNAVSYDKGSTTSFEVYFPKEITAGSVEVLDKDGNIISTIDIKPNPAGVYQFDWNGELSNGTQADSGVYYISASYSDANGDSQTTRLGAYPIESVRFDNGETFLKVGSAYVPLTNIKEVY